MSPIKTLASLLLPVLLTTASTASDRDLVDRVVLTSGKQLSGRVLLETPEKLVLDTGAKEREIPMAEVTSVDSVERSLEEFLARFDAADQLNVDALLELARFAEEHELPGEARNTYLRVLSIDPNNEDAWNKLGGHYSKRLGWRLRVRGRYRTIDQLRERVSDWRRALELTTAHFYLRTDITPERALDISINIERAYLEFYRLFGEELELFVFDEAPSIFIYASEKEFPKPLFDGKNAWYTALDNILYVNGDLTGGADARETMRHFIDLMMSTSFRRTQGRPGETSPFVSRGVGLLFAAALDFDQAWADWEFGRPNEELFRRHAAAKKPFGIARIVNASEGDYVGADNAALTVAQAYTLVYFLIFAEDGKYRPAAARFLQSSFLGQPSASHLEKILGVDLDNLGLRYEAYVDAVVSKF